MEREEEKGTDRGKAESSEIEEGRGRATYGQRGEGEGREEEGEKEGIGKKSLKLAGYLHTEQPEQDSLN